MLGAPELDAGLLMGSQQSGAEGQNPLPRPAAHAAGGMQPRVQLAFWAASAHCRVVFELLVNQHPQVLLLRAAPNPFSAQPVFMPVCLTAFSSFILPLSFKDPESF